MTLNELLAKLRETEETMRHLQRLVECGVYNGAELLAYHYAKDLREFINKAVTDPSQS